MLVESYLNRQLAHLPEGLAGSIADQLTLRKLSEVKRIVFSSTSLLYDGPPRLSQYFGVQDQTLETKQQVLQIAASLASGSRLPLYASFMQAAVETGLPLREMETDSLAGNGVVGKLDRTWYVLGDEVVMNSEKVELGATSRVLMQQLELAGRQMYFLAQKQPKRLLGIFAVEPRLLPGAAASMQGLSQMGIELILLTGEKKRVAAGITQQLGIAVVHSEMREEDKGQLILSLQEQVPETAVLLNREQAYLSGLALPILVGNNSSQPGTVGLAHLNLLPNLLSYCQDSMERARKRFFWCKI
jgi:Cu+-exporting ATPase